MRTEAETGMAWPQAEEHLRPPAAERDPEGSAGARPRRHLDLGLPTPRTVRGYISVILSTPVCGPLLQQLQEAPASTTPWGRASLGLKCRLLAVAPGSSAGGSCLRRHSCPRFSLLPCGQMHTCLWPMPVLFHLPTALPSTNALESQPTDQASPLSCLTAA